jgi:hypothetical protein
MAGAVEGQGLSRNFILYGFWISINYTKRKQIKNLSFIIIIIILPIYNLLHRKGSNK